MQVDVIPGRRLDAALAARWREIQAGNAELASPFFAPEFTQAVAAARDDVEIAVIRESGSPVAFFPFQRKTRTVAGPVGGVLSDYQGLICAPGFACDPLALLRGCGLIAWDFDHLLASQAAFARYHRFSEGSPQIDLSRGYDAYASERRAAGSEQIKKCGNLMRRIEREAGPLRFVARSPDAGLLGRLLQWKSRQFLESGKSDLFALTWVRDVLARMQATQTEGCSGMLSLLYAGERLIAAHFGMRSKTVLHWWFPAYDPAAGKYSPGLILLLKAAESAAALGIPTLDLGKGTSLYKSRLMSRSVNLASGSLEPPSLRAYSHQLGRTLRAAVARSPLGRPLRFLLHRFFRQ